jgi:hypothetical protein
VNPTLYFSTLGESLIALIALRQSATIPIRMVTLAPISEVQLFVAHHLHTFRDELPEADIPIDEVKALDGWARKDVHDAYGSGLRIATFAVATASKREIWRITRRVHNAKANVNCRGFFRVAVP